MSLSSSKIVPAAFWVGFLALGFATSLGGPAKHRVENAARPARTAAAAQAIVAQTEKPALLRLEVHSAAHD